MPDHADLMRGSKATDVWLARGKQLIRRLFAACFKRDSGQEFLGLLG